VKVLFTDATNPGFVIVINAADARAGAKTLAVRSVARINTVEMDRR
jgi:hypothetical protein